MFNILNKIFKNEFITFISFILIFSLVYLFDSNLILLTLLCMLIILLNSYLVLSVNKELDLKIISIKNQFIDKITLNKEILINLKNNYFDLKFLKNWTVISLNFFEIKFLLFKFIIVNFKNNSKSLLFLYFFKFLNKKIQNQIKIALTQN